MSMSDYVMRKLVRMQNYSRNEMKMVSMLEDKIHQWVDDMLKRWEITPMHSTEYIGSEIYAETKWFRIDLIGVDKTVLVSVWVEEY